MRGIRIPISIRMYHPTAIIISQEYQRIKDLAYELTDAIDEEAIEDAIYLGFWSIVYVCDGELEYNNWERNFQTQLLFGIIDEEEYRLIINNEEEEEEEEEDEVDEVDEVDEEVEIEEEEEIYFPRKR